MPSRAGPHLFDQLSSQRVRWLGKFASTRIGLGTPARQNHDTDNPSQPKKHPHAVFIQRKSPDARIADRIADETSGHISENCNPSKPEAGQGGIFLSAADAYVGEENSTLPRVPLPHL